MEEPNNEFSCCGKVYTNTLKNMFLYECEFCSEVQFMELVDFTDHLNKIHEDMFVQKFIINAEEYNTYIKDEDNSLEFQDINSNKCTPVYGDSNGDTEDWGSMVEYVIERTNEVTSPYSNSMEPDSELSQLSISPTQIKEESNVNDEMNKNNVKVIARKSVLKASREENNSNERRYKCEQCGFAFKEMFNLRQHIRRHNQAERYACAECPKRFHTRTELVTHERRHRGELPYMCAECGRRFVTSGALSQHTLRHDNYRPYKCDKCEKRFYDTSQLKHHKVVHTRERTHTCTICNAKFARRKSLITHMKIHANKREYVCSICFAAYNQAPGLRMHLRTKHKDIIP